MLEKWYCFSFSCLLGVVTGALETAEGIPPLFKEPLSVGAAFVGFNPVDPKPVNFEILRTTKDLPENSPHGHVAAVLVWGSEPGHIQIGIHCEFVKFRSYELHSQLPSCHYG